jgi:hypothetical protein
VSKEMQDLLEACKGNLRPEYDLVYVDQGDKLDDEQVGYVVAAEWPALWESNAEWESENRHDGARYEAKDVLKDTLTSWVRGGTDSDRYTELYDEFKGSQWWDDLIDEIKDRDRSDAWKELAHMTPQVLMRHVLAGEDSALYGNHSPTAVWRWLRDACEEGSVFKRTKHNLDVIRAVTAESMHSLAYSMGMLVYATDVGDLYDMGDVEWVEVVNPFLYIGNYYNGDGYCSDEPLHGTFRIKRKDLRTDKSAPGYGWDEVAGVYTSAYEAEVRAVKDENTNQEVA